MSVNSTPASCVSSCLPSAVWRYATIPTAHCTQAKIISVSSVDARSVRAALFLTLFLSCSLSHSAFHTSYFSAPQEGGGTIR